jgi:hypothetical protein
MKAWLPTLFFGVALLVGVSGGIAQAGSGEGQAAPGESASTVSNDPAAGAAGSIEPEAGSTASHEPAAQTPPPQKLLCMWRNKGVTGFCDVAPETPVGTSCACRSVIEHRAKKFTGKVIVSR